MLNTFLIFTNFRFRLALTRGNSSVSLPHLILLRKACRFVELDASADGGALLPGGAKFDELNEGGGGGVFC